MLLTSFKTNCYICGKPMELYTGFEHWSIQKPAGEILPLCKKCSRIIKRFITDLKTNEPKKIKKT